MRWALFQCRGPPPHFKTREEEEVRGARDFAAEEGRAHSLCQLLQLVFMLTSVAGTQSNVELRPVFCSSEQTLTSPPSQSRRLKWKLCSRTRPGRRDLFWSPGAQSASNVFKASLGLLNLNMWLVEACHMSCVWTVYC